MLIMSPPCVQLTSPIRYCQTEYLEPFRNVPIPHSRFQSDIVRQDTSRVAPQLSHHTDKALMLLRKHYQNHKQSNTLAASWQAVLRSPTTTTMAPIMSSRNNNSGSPAVLVKTLRLSNSRFSPTLHSATTPPSALCQSLRPSGKSFANSVWCQTLTKPISRIFSCTAT